MNNETPLTVVAEILPGKADPSTTARFANSSRAEQYARLLFDSGDYARVTLNDGTETHEVFAR
jgi:hypothetical protein